MNRDFSKEALRKTFKQARHRLDLSKINLSIRQHLLTHPHLLASKVIFAYMALPEEVNLEPLFHALPQIIWGIPRCLPGHQLAWHHFSSDCTWVTHPSGISEPHPETPCLDPRQADLVLVPALACDSQGYRLGYGAGYYDRFLSAYPLRAWGIIPKVCFSERDLPRDPWDIPLQAVVTEDGVLIMNL